MRVCFCPPRFSLVYYWYGANRHSEGTLPRWVEKLIETTIEPVTEPTEEPEDSDGGIPATEDNPDPESDLETEGVMNMDLHLPEPSQRNEKTKYSLRKRITKPSRLYHSSLG